jgi:hypothetical protein
VTADAVTSLAHAAPHTSTHTDMSNLAWDAARVLHEALKRWQRMHRRVMLLMLLPWFVHGRGAGEGVLMGSGLVVRVQGGRTWIGACCSHAVTRDKASLNRHQPWHSAPAAGMTSELRPAGCLGWCRKTQQERGGGGSAPPPPRGGGGQQQGTEMGAGRMLHSMHTTPGNMCARSWSKAHAPFMHTTPINMSARIGAEDKFHFMQTTPGRVSASRPLAKHAANASGDARIHNCVPILLPASHPSPDSVTRRKLPLLFCPGENMYTLFSSCSSLPMLWRLQAVPKKG